MRKSEYGSRLRFFSGLALVVLCIFSIGYFVNEVVFQSLKASYKTIVDKLLDESSALVDGFAQNQFHLLDIYANVPSVQQGSFKDIPKWFFTERASSVVPKRFSIIDSEGHGISSDGGSYFAGDRSYFLDALKTGRAIQGPLPSRVDGQPVLVFALSLVHPTRSAAVLTSAVDPGGLSEVLSSVRELQGVDIRLDSNQGTVLLDFGSTEHAADLQVFEVRKKLASIPAVLTLRATVQDFMRPVNNLLVLVGITTLLISTIVSWLFLRSLAAKRRYYFSLQENISTLEIANAKVSALAYFDQVTELPNRHSVISSIAQTLESKSESNLLIAEIRDFLELNAKHGMHFTDKVLRQSATRIIEHVPLTDGLFVGRISGSQFLLMLPSFLDASDVARTIIRSFGVPMGSDEFPIHIAINIGICPLMNSGSNPDEIIRSAQASLVLARKLGPNQFSVLSESDIRKQDRLRLLETLMHTGWSQGEFEVHYQPQVHASSGQIEGFEALLRWKNPKIGSVSPGEFIPIAEESGFITTLGKWVFEQALEFAHELFVRNVKATVSVNVSAVQLLDGDLLDSFFDLIAAKGVPYELIGLEFTESVIIQTNEQFLPSLMRIMASGVKISIDDFGTGYSSLTSIRRLPFNVLKLDKAFIDDLVTDSKAYDVIKSLIEMSHHIGLSVVAEGVESSAQFVSLNKMKCDTIQGYLTGKPTSSHLLLASQFERFALEVSNEQV